MSGERGWIDYDDHNKMIDDLVALVNKLSLALEPFAKIPIEEFGLETKPNQHLHGWKKHVIYIRDVLAARAALKS